MADNISASISKSDSLVRPIARVGFVAALILGLFVLQGCDPVGALRPLGLFEGADAPKPGRPAPRFALKDMDGNYELLSNFRGQQVVMSFWAASCAPCKAQLADLDRFARERAGEVIVVLVDSEDSEEKIRPVLADAGVQLRTFLDTESEVTSNYYVSELPTTFVISSSGIVMSVEIGAIDYEWLVEHTK